MLGLKVEAVDRVIRTSQREVYNEILDVLNTRREYLERTSNALRPDREARLAELCVVRAIINTLKGGEDE
jgi:hypothetical protein